MNSNVIVRLDVFQLRGRREKERENEKNLKNDTILFRIDRTFIFFAVNKNIVLDDSTIAPLID